MSTSRRQQVTTYLHQRQFTEAEQYCRQWIQAQPQDPEALYWLGVVRAYQGFQEEGLHWLDRALEYRPEDPLFHRDRGFLLIQLHRLSAAIEALQRSLELDPAQVSAYPPLIQALHRLERWSEAKTVCEQALAQNEDNGMLWALYGATWLSMNQVDSAIEALQWSIVLDPEVTQTYLNLGVALQQAGRYIEAEPVIQQAIALDPDNPDYHYHYGCLTKKMQCYPQAETALKTAVNLKSDHLDAWNELGDLQLRLHRWDKAEAIYQQALDQDPTFPTTYFNFTALLELLNRLPEASELMSRGLHYHPHRYDMNLIAAKLERRQGRIEAALEILNRPVDPPTAPHLTILKEFELGSLYNTQKDPDRAFQHFQTANQLQKRIQGADIYDKQHYLNYLDHIWATLTESWVHSWTDTPSMDPGDDSEDDSGAIEPVFIVGFPRSGTTLLGQILDSHPHIQVADERGLFSSLESYINQSIGPIAQVLPQLSAEQIRHLRAVYRQTLDQHLSLLPGTTVFVDKDPFNLVKVMLMVRLFPQARILFVLRHPYDVCLSCFMQAFEIGSHTASFFTLADTAHLYSRMMDIWLRSRALLNPNVYEIRYEQVVETLEISIRDLLHFIGIEWDPAVLKHDRHAQQHGRIQTPSYSQVTQAIYTSAKYRWHQYAHYLEPLKAVIDPYSQHFGYDLDP